MVFWQGEWNAAQEITQAQLQGLENSNEQRLERGQEILVCPEGRAVITRLI